MQTKAVHLSLLFSMLLPMLLSACASTKFKVLTKKEISRELRAVNTSTQKRKESSGTIFVNWKNSKKNITATGILLLRWPDKLQLELQNPLGQTLAYLVLNGDKFWWYQNKKVQTGNITSPERQLPIPLSSRTLLQALLARPGINKSYIWKGIKNSNEVMLYPGTTNQERLRWNSALKEPTQWRKKLTSTSRLITHYSNYQVHSGIRFPMHIKLQILQKKRKVLTINWYWEEISNFISPKSKPFTIPPRWAKHL